MKMSRRYVRFQAEEEKKHDHHHHDHEHEHEEHEHEHHHHDHEHEEHEHEHHHHEDYDGDEEHCPHCHHDHDHEHEEHEHHHHHHADDVFTSWGKETARQYTTEEIQSALEALSNEEVYGVILRAKGIVAGTDGQWIHYDYVPGTPDVRHGSPATTGRLCVIGSKSNETEIAKLFHAE